MNVFNDEDMATPKKNNDRWILNKEYHAELKAKEERRLKDIAISISKLKDFSLEINDAHQTSNYNPDTKHMIISIKGMPENIKDNTWALDRIRTSLTIHECGHRRMTHPNIEQINKWIKRQGNPNLAKHVCNIIEDARINYFHAQRFKWDVGEIFSWFLKLTGESWKNTTKNKVEKRTYLLQDITPYPFLMDLICIGGIYEIDISDLTPIIKKEFGNSSGIRKDYDDRLKRGIEIIEESKRAFLFKNLEKHYTDLYNILLIATPANNSYLKESIPVFMGGNMKLEAKEGDVIKADAEAKAHADAEAEAKGMDAGAGSGAGNSIPTPTPNMEEYERMLEKNRELIDEILKKIKLQMPVITEVKKYQRTGRMMNKMLAGIYAQSLSREVNNVYERKTIRMEKEKLVMALLVDLSGSVDIPDAKDSLLVVSEVMNSWLRDEDYGVFVFGSDFQKLKYINEIYNTVKYRIGGVNCLGGTNMTSPLKEIRRMFKKVSNGRRKVLVIWSDFWVDRQSETLKELKNLSDEGVDIIPLQCGNRNDLTESLKRMGLKIGKCDNVKALPKAFTDVYISRSSLRK